MKFKKNIIRIMKKQSKSSQIHFQSIHITKSTTNTMIIKNNLILLNQTISIFIQFWFYLIFCKYHLLNLPKIRIQQYYQQMGIQREGYPFVFKTATISVTQSYQQFQKDFLSSLDVRSDIFISNIFNPQSLTKDKINLDDCFVPAHETFTSKQLLFLCPLINDQLITNSQIEHRLEKLKFIIEYCSYLGLKKIAIRFNHQKYQEIISTLENMAKYIKKGRITVIVINAFENSKESHEENWRSFIQLRRKLKEITTLALILQIRANLPEKWILKRWMGEHISFLSINQQAFILNNKGYPVLPNPHEQAVKQFMRRHCNLAIHYETITTNHQKQPYFKYLGFVLDKLIQSMSKYDTQAQNLIDYLQAPLQPYIDNLEGEVYDIFQFDSFKYNEYQLAFIAAMNSFTENRVFIAYYVGSGKGLILSKLISACKVAKKKIKVYCIQKNPYPLQSLKRRIQRNKWSKFVEIVQTDIKQYKMPEHPDLIFSELLGGFGDNELSPQCIKWAQKNATKQTRMIPEKYTAFIKPISCSILYEQLPNQEKQSYFTVNFGLHYAPFQSKPVWSFQHPLAREDDLNRFAILQWTAKEAVAIHGFQGSFDCNLFEKAYFSIVPETLNKDFYSWFPLFFSFKDEQLVSAGEIIVIQIHRKTSPEKIWYQWQYAIKNIHAAIRKESSWHNQNGITAIRLTE